MSKKKKIKDILFILILLFGVFGVFFIYVAWMYWKKVPVQNPNGADYTIPGKFSEQYPDALYYDFENYMPAEVALSSTARSGKASLLAQGRSGVINISLDDKDEGKMERLNLEAWLYSDAIKTSKEAALVIVISNAANHVKFSKSIAIHNNTAKQWFRLSASIRHAGTYEFDRGDRLRIFLLNKSGAPIMMDDLTIQFGGGNNSVCANASPISISGGNTPPYPLLYMSPFGSQVPAYCDDLKGKLNGYYDVFTAPVLFSGNFFAAIGSLPEIAVVNTGSVAVFVPNAQLKSMQGMRLLTPETDTVTFVDRACIKGDFDGDRREELLIQYLETNSFFMFDGVVSNTSKSFKVSVVRFPMKEKISKVRALPSVSGSQAEVLCIGVSGKWQRFVWKQQQWVSTITSATAVKEWDAAKYSYSVTVLPDKNGNTLLLTVFASLLQEDSGFYLGVLNTPSKQYQSIYKSANGQGVYSGTDRLMPDDKFYVVNFVTTGTWQLLRVRDKWRYEVNLLGFDDTTYHVMGAVDFEPLAGTENPKYDPDMLLLPVCLQSAHSNALMIFNGPIADPLKQQGKTGSMQIYRPKQQGIKK